MNDVKRAADALHEAALCLPIRYQKIVDKLPESIRAGTEEVRLRVGREITVSINGREQAVGDFSITESDLREVVSRAAHESVHTYSESLRQGFLTMAGGHRIGICGSATVQDEHFAGVREISSLNLRVARPVTGCAEEIYKECFKDGPQSMVLLSPPGFGKTTLLRDFIRCLSASSIRVSVADERGEIAALRDGKPQFELGEHVDVMELCSKAEAMMCLLKTMSPQVLALDEITARGDTAAILSAAHCGVYVLATAHANNLSEFKNRSIYKPVIRNHVFSIAVSIVRDLDGKRTFTVQQLGGI